MLLPSAAVISSKAIPDDPLGNIAFKYNLQHPDSVLQVKRVSDGKLVRYRCDGEGSLLSYDDHSRCSMISIDKAEILFAHDAQGQLLQRTDS